MLQYQDLRRLLGPCIQAYAIPDMDNKAFSEEKNYVSSSGLKDYLVDPELALRQRVLKTSPTKEHTDLTLSKFRKGRAVHTGGLEGRTKLQAEYPVFSSSSKKAGPQWEKFTAEHPQAYIQDNILLKKEQEEIETLVDVLEKGIQERRKFMQGQGWEIVKYFPEMSIFAVYQSGLAIKVRLDALFILRVSGQLFIVIQDVKTTSSSVTDTAKLQYDIEKFFYHLQGVIYLNTAQEVLSRPAILQSLGVDGVPQGNHVELPAVYDLLWVSKTALMCGFQNEFLRYLTVDSPERWDHWGIGAAMAAIAHYNHVHKKTEKLIRDAHLANSKDALNEIGGVIPVPPRNNIKYSHGRYIDLAESLRESTLHIPVTEQLVRQKINQLFPKQIAPFTVVMTGEDKAPEAEAEVETEAVKGDGITFPKDAIKTLSKKELRAHPALGKLNIDWSTNINTVRSQIRKELGWRNGHHKKETECDTKKNLPLLPGENPKAKGRPKAKRKRKAVKKEVGNE